MRRGLSAAHKLTHDLFLHRKTYCVRRKSPLFSPLTFPRRIFRVITLAAVLPNRSMMLFCFSAFHFLTVFQLGLSTLSVALEMLAIYRMERGGCLLLCVDGPCLYGLTCGSKVHGILQLFASYNVGNLVKHFALNT
jgi:hypothetical protein